MSRRFRPNPDPGAIQSLTEESVMSYQTVNPATAALVETFPPISEYELERVLAIAHNTFETDWRKRTVADRARIIDRGRCGFQYPTYSNATRCLEHDGRNRTAQTSE
jgi:hypothetical protein